MRKQLFYIFNQKKVIKIVVVKIASGTPLTIGRSKPHLRFEKFKMSQKGRISALKIKFAKS